MKGDTTSNLPLSHWLVSTLIKLSDFIIQCVYRLNSIQSCDQQLQQFRSLSGSLLRWLQMAQEQLPAKEPNLNTEGLQRRVQQLKVGVC